ncbi:CDP-diacylglycerol--serine O-phosphatidyltransferase [Lewinellaceae bacterium SD302]|nr:CDP-diacylglycerol--serine O-phosphatidyltransferase [Lewinellaceae bacterium SD302]
MKAWIPNAITLLNLLCGCAAVVNILDGQFIPAFWFLFAAGWFDFADGLVARLLKVSSEHGKELDSLADMVSFGFVPGIIYYVFLYYQSSSISIDPDALMAGDELSIGWSWYAAPGLLVTLFSALRLAKFNLDDRQTDDFIGLATPSSTVYATGLMLIYATDAFGWGHYVLSPWVLYPSILLMSYLLVAEIPMFSFKVKGFGWVGNRKRFIFAAVAIGLLVFLRQAAFPFIIIAYLIINLATRLFAPSAA